VIVYAASDHAGYGLRKTLLERLRNQGHQVTDLGTDSDAACDYPEFASAVANSVRAMPGALGILVCATGQGMAIAAGKVRGIRAVVPATVEAARLSRFDNDANVLCLAGRLMSEGDTFAIVDTWLSTPFAGGRHARRIAKVAAIETASAVAFITEGEHFGLSSRGIPARLFARDPALFTSDESKHAAIEQSLAWLATPSEMTEQAARLNSLAVDVRQARFKDLIVIGRADRSPALAVCRIWASASGGLRMHVLGDDASALATIETATDLQSALVLVVADGQADKGQADKGQADKGQADKGQADKGIEGKERQIWTRMLELCGGDAERAGKHFAAVAPSHSPFAETAQSHHYREFFCSPAGVAESFSVLGYPGLVPATLFGLDVKRLMTQAQAMAESCRAERLDTNPGISLGLLIGALAKHGRNKLTLLLSKSLRPVGSWIADIIACATGADPRRITTVWDEPLQPSYPPNRIFVQIQAADDVPAIPPNAMEALHFAGQPYIQITVQDKYELSGEIYRWQVAATVAALVQSPVF
jgi:RpiB/LacA/LacB family sugar-phosphate isomerase